MSPVSDRQRLANAANATKSTGPRTPRGKVIAARNALRHGIFARQILLPGESADELAELKTAMIRRLNPRDPLEMELVERVINACWKLRRLQRFEATLFEQQTADWNRDSADDRERHGLGRRETIPAEALWHEAPADFREQVERLSAQEQKLENAMRRSLRELALLQKTDIEQPLTEFAAERVDREQAAQQNWRNEANRLTALQLAADLADAQAERTQRATARAAEAEDDAANEESEDGRLEDVSPVPTSYSLPSRRNAFPEEFENRENEPNSEPGEVAGGSHGLTGATVNPLTRDTVAQVMPPSPCTRGEGRGEGLHR